MGDAVTGESPTGDRAGGPETPGPGSFWAVIPAGGAGTRLWPLSRAERPKFLLDLFGTGRSMLQATVDRLRPLCEERCVVVTGAAHEAAVREQLPELADGGLIAEPQPRDSMAAIGLAAAVIERRDPEAIIGSFAADHVIGQEEVFRETVLEAVAVAEHGFVVTIGITPTEPATGFGYIRRGDSTGVEGAPHGYHVHSFVEKPDLVTANRYLSEGGYFWNAGMFVVKARVLLDLLTTYLPELAAGLRRIAAGEGDAASIWDGLQRISIDHAVAEPAAADGQVAVVMGGFPWNDVGDYQALSELIPASSVPGLRVIGNAADVIASSADGLVVSRSGRMVTVLGLSGVVVVDTPDALLVTTRDYAQQVKGIVDSLKEADRHDLT